MSKKKAVKKGVARRTKAEILSLSAAISAPKSFAVESAGGEIEVQSWYNSSYPKHGRRMTSVLAWSDDSEGSYVRIDFHDPTQLRGIIKALRSHCSWMEDQGMKGKPAMTVKKKKTKRKPSQGTRRSPEPKRIEENRNGLQPAYLGDKVWWDDDEEDFTGIYDVTSIGDDPEDQHADTTVWLYSGERGKEVEVSLREIQNRINPLRP